MARIKITITLSPQAASDEHILFLGSTHIKRWRIPIQSPVVLQFGSFRKELRVVPIEGSSAVRIHPQLADELGLHKGVVLSMRYQRSDRSLVIGPLIGVLLRRIEQNTDKPFGGVTSFCRELTAACEQLGAHVYFIAADQLTHREGQTLSGLTYANGWKRKSFPYPDVLYNRLTSRIVENSEPVQRFLHYFAARPGTSLFNERYLNKAEVFEALKKESSLHLHLPESYLYKKQSMLRGMLERHRSVFLKPILSSLGKGIIRIEKKADGMYTCQMAAPTGAIRRVTYSSLPRLFNALSPRMKGKTYLIQEGLDLIQVAGAPVDFRALVQRDQHGEWKVTSVVARIAAKHTFLSNLARGGKLSAAGEAISRSSLSAALQSSMASRLSKAATDIAVGLEKQIDAHFAELGIDLAVDTRGRVMLLEINSKPSKEDNTPLAAGEENNPADTDTKELRIRPSVKRVVQYSRFLTKL